MSTVIENKATSETLGIEHELKDDLKESKETKRNHLSDDGVFPENDNRITSAITTFNAHSLFLGIIAWLGYFNTYAVRFYLAAFIMSFAEQENLSKLYCNLASAVFQVTTLITPLVDKRIRLLGSYSLKTRGFIYSMFVAVFNGTTVLMDYLIKWDDSGTITYLFLGFMRALQGAGTGYLFVIMQGEIVDVYWKGNAMVAGVISSAMHVPPMIGGTIAAALYESGGWTAAATVFSGFLVLQSFMLLCVNFNKIPLSDKEEDVKESRSNKTKLSVEKTVIFVIPDIVLFFNTVTFAMIAYTIPFRLTHSSGTGYTLTMANLLLSIMSITSFISTFILTYIASKKPNTLLFIIAGNYFYFGGVVLIYGATTEYLSFTGCFEIGVVLAGIGDAAITNLCIPCKFDLYKKWGRDVSSLGVKATTYLNTAMASAATTGIILASFVVTPESEVPTLVTIGVVCLINTAGLSFAIARK